MIVAAESSVLEIVKFASAAPLLVVFVAALVRQHVVLELAAELSYVADEFVAWFGTADGSALGFERAVEAFVPVVA